ncbi:hypothetical protein DDE82_006981 [Stemphylium lycopersici]|nr:hypothetical protein DDE82_006981 [Stemphylium lycopersici]
MSTPFSIPTPPIDLRRDIQAYQIHHEESTRGRIRDSIELLLDALHHHEPVDRNCQEYKNIEKTFCEKLQLVTKIHDSYGARYHFLVMRKEFRKVKHMLYTEADQTGGSVSSGKAEGVEEAEGEERKEGVDKLDKAKGSEEGRQGKRVANEQDKRSETASVADSKKSGKQGSKAKGKKPRKEPSPSRPGEESDSSLRNELDQSGFGIEGLHDTRKKSISKT